MELTRIQHVISELAKEDHSDADCLLVTVLTHGLNSHILQAYDKLYEVEELWLPFTADKCLSLAGKPKIFIIQACRGDKFNPGVTLKQEEAMPMQTDTIHETYRIPACADFLIAFSSVEDYKSWRIPKEGTWFIQSFCEELQKHASTKDLLKIFTQTAHRVAVDYESSHPLCPDKHKKKQVPCTYTMLIRDLHLHPKIKN